MTAPNMTTQGFGWSLDQSVTGATSILAQNTTGSLSSVVYMGSNMPAGYTESARISVWPTNASGQFVVGYKLDNADIVITGYKLI